MKSTKGQISSLQGIIVTLIVVAIIIAVGLFIVQEFFEQDSFSDTSGSVTNETGGWLNQTAYTVGQAGVPGFNSFELTGLWNTSSDTVIPLANATTNADETVTTNADLLYNSSDVQFSYTYLHGDAGYEGVNSTLEAMRTVPDLLPLIILIVMVGVILAVLFNVIPGTRSLGA